MIKNMLELKEHYEKVVSNLESQVISLSKAKDSLVDQLNVLTDAHVINGGETLLVPKFQEENLRLKEEVEKWKDEYHNLSKFVNDYEEQIAELSYMEKVYQMNKDWIADAKETILGLKSALEFYAERSVYEKLNQFPGDSELSECSDVARLALKRVKK